MFASRKCCIRIKQTCMYRHLWPVLWNRYILKNSQNIRWQGESDSACPYRYGCTVECLLFISSTASDNILFVSFHSEISHISQPQRSLFAVILSSSIAKTAPAAERQLLVVMRFRHFPNQFGRTSVWGVRRDNICWLTDDAFHLAKRIKRRRRWRRTDVH